MSVCTKLFHFFRKICGGDAQCVRLTRGIDISQNQMVSMRERFRKLDRKSVV